MKRCVLSLFLSLSLLAGCSSAAAPTAVPAAPPSPKPAVVTLAASAQSKLVIHLIDCNNSIGIQEAKADSIAFSGSSDRYQYTVEGPKNGVTTVRITQTYNPDLSGATLTVPLNAYRAIRVESNNSGVSLHPQSADYEVEATDSAFSATIPYTYAGKLSGWLKDSAAAVNLSGQNPNLALKFDLANCAISAPDTWGYKEGQPLTLSRGTGGASLSLTFTDCAVSVEESTLGFPSRYEGVRSATSISTSGSSLEMLFGDMSFTGWNGNEFSQWRSAAKPNFLTDISTIPAQGITALQLNANLCALVLAPSKSGAFELAYQGVQDVKTITVTAVVENGLLTVTAEGTLKDYLYLSADPDWRVNCVRLLVPEGILKSLSLDCGEGLIASNGLALPAVTGGTTRGVVCLNSTDISAPITMSTNNSDLKVIADTVSAPVSMTTGNGCAELVAKTVSGDVTLTTKNGDVGLDVGTATGRLALTAKNGCVEAKVQSVKNADFRAANGDVEVTLGTITGDTLCAVTNGTMEVTLTKKPANLTFRLDGGWEENRWNSWDENWCEDWYNKEERPLGLPSGWSDGLVLGNGVPILTLSASSNGDVSFSVPVK